MDPGPGLGPHPGPHLGPHLGPRLQIGTADVLVGTCSWADATLTKDANWYPKKTMKAAERLAYYASQFPIVEIDSTYYFPPTPELCEQWAERTPEGFTFDVKAWSLLTGHPTFPHSLFEDLQSEVKPEFRDKRNLYAKHLPKQVVAECWMRFRHALKALHEAGKLGGVLLQYPEWVGPKESHRSMILDAVEQLDPYPCLIEFRNAKWLQGEENERTFEWLERHGLTFVCVDEPQGFASSMPPVLTATAPLGVIRFHGHNDDNWERKGITAAERFRYLYSDDELAQWAPRLRELAGTVDTLHVLWNNCWQDHAVNNAASIAGLLADDLLEVHVSAEAGVDHRSVVHNNAPTGG
jgi:uncharacterized protein YecE (DUF72 family)